MLMTMMMMTTPDWPVVWRLCELPPSACCRHSHLMSYHISRWHSNQRQTWKYT